MKKILSGLLLGVMMVCILAGCGITVPRPEIKKAEFDVTVTYEWNGEQKTVSDVFVCEYDGTFWTLDGGSHRAWKGYLKDNAEDVIEIGTTKNGDRVVLNLALLPEYFMDDFVEGDREVPAPYISVMIENDEGMRVLYEPEDVEDYCGAKIISYSYDEPIENEFGLFK